VLPGEPRSSGYEQLEQAFSHAATGCAVTDAAGKCVAINAAFVRILALEASSADDANIFELTHPDDQPRHQSLLKQLFAGEIPGFIIEKRYVRPDGTSTWVRNSVTVFEKRNASKQKVLRASPNSRATSRWLRPST
jgi:PAS domain S-box-containing protein